MAAEMEVVPQKMVEVKTVVLKTRLDSNVARLQAEGLKRDFFAKLGFFKPKIEEIQLIGYEKYYEPYIVIGGKYSLDYCKKHVFPIKVEKPTRGVFIDGKKYETAASKSGINLDQMIRLEGEEHVHYERETFFVLDKLRREISPKSFPFAPYEVQPEGFTDINLNLRKISISGNEIIELLRSKIARRPKDIAKIIREIFEIKENTIVYRPFFEFTFHNTKTKEYVTLKVDGVSGDKLLYKYDNRNMRTLCPNSCLDRADFSTTEAKLVSDNSKQKIGSQSCNLSEKIFPEPHISEFQPHKAAASSGNVTLKFPANVSGEVFVVGDNVTAVVGDLEIPSGATINDTLVVKGKLKIGDNCKLSRRVKVLGDVIIGINTVINGDVISGGNVGIGSNSMIGGCIKAAGTIEFSEKVRVGKGLKRSSDQRKEPFDLEMIVESEKKEALV
jgi:carbonic anhydrase/acetyltransferase-like protein (isoleucine patch superfamily)